MKNDPDEQNNVYLNQEFQYGVYELQNPAKD
jgi:hypothetical protein